MTFAAKHHSILTFPPAPNPFSAGRLIHEFDPWFNYHATRYLFTHGAKKFFTWFDHTAWYPIGRPVGTTIYPGMQFTSVAIWHLLNRYLGIKMSLNDICVFVPAWFGAIASVLTGFLAAVRCQGPRGDAWKGRPSRSRGLGVLWRHAHPQHFFQGLESDRGEGQGFTR